MELRHLRYFVAVAEELHFRRAAERLHMSQPPLSQQIRALEADVGAQLLVRSRRRVELTEAGKVFLREARAVLEAADRASDLARRVSRGEVGRLAVGFVGSAMYSAVPEILRRFRGEHPDVELHLREVPTGLQLEALESGELDVGFIRPPVPGQDLRVETIQTEKVVVALPASHPLARRKRLRLEALGHEALVLLARREAPGLHETLAVAMAGVGGSTWVVQEVAEMQTAIGLVAAGLGISLVPASVASLDRDGVVYRPISGPAPTVELALAWRLGDQAPALERFLAVARRQ